MSNESFRPQGNSVLIAATSSTASSPTQISTGWCVATYFANPSTSPVYIAYGSSSVQAGVPTTAVPCVGMCFPSGTGGLINTGPSNTFNWLSVVTSAGSASVFATPGSGK